MPTNTALQDCYRRLVAENEISITINYDGEPEANYSPCAKKDLARVLMTIDREAASGLLEASITAAARETYGGLIDAYTGELPKIAALSEFWIKTTTELTTQAFQYVLDEALDREEVIALLRSHRDYVRLYRAWELDNADLPDFHAEAAHDYKRARA